MAFTILDKKNAPVSNTASWDPASWQSKTIRHMPVYADIAALNAIEAQLHQSAPLVAPFEVEALKQQLAKVAKGEAFLLQGGDCAERFADCNPKVIGNKLNILLKMSVILLHGLQKPIVRVGRIAGQYAKPRSNEYEIQNAIRLPTYRGDMINRPGFTLADRTPDPYKMQQAYGYAAQTLKYLRALAQKDLNRIQFYTSHEALLLPYEQALTHKHGGKWYNLSTHFPWVGMRTAQLDSAHIEYLRGIHNPVAIKVGPNMTCARLAQLVNRLNPNNEPGRLTLIHRLGKDKVAKRLPSLIKSVQATGKSVLWCCDPMHGNTRITAQGIKTRHFDDMLTELRLCFDIHAKLKSYLGGIHIELASDNVTECTGGTRGLTVDDLDKAYTSLVDPRLNYEQALEMAIAIPDRLNMP